MEEGLRATIRVIVPDQSGELKKILAIFEGLKVNINEINHERSSNKVEVGKTMITISVNLQDMNQLNTIVNMLHDHGMYCEVVS